MTDRVSFIGTLVLEHHDELFKGSHWSSYESSIRKNILNLSSGGSCNQPEKYVE